jgi:hypothetical protein
MMKWNRPQVTNQRFGLYGRILKTTSTTSKDGRFEIIRREKTGGYDIFLKDNGGRVPGTYAKAAYAKAHAERIAQGIEEDEA